MAVVPPPAVVDAINEGTSQVVRRMEIFESDGETPWEFPESDGRFIDGAISIDFSRDERRMLDVTLRNDDGALRPSPLGGLWYDKVFKFFRGVEYSARTTPSIAIIEEGNAGTGFPVKMMLQNLGFSRVDMRLDATKFEDVSDYDILVVVRGAAVTASAKVAMARAAYDAGRNVITFGTLFSEVSLPFVTSSIGGHSTTWGATPVTSDTPIVMNWNSHSFGTWTGTIITGVDPSATVVGTWTSSTNGATFYSAIVAQNINGDKWFHYSPYSINTTGSRLLWKSAIDWMHGSKGRMLWETQVGEFVSDNIAHDNFPRHVRIVGRDYTKRCLKSKFGKATAFDAGESGAAIIRALAANSGIRKMKVPEVGWSLPARLDFAPETPRWEVMKQISTAFQHDIYFDAQGYLTVTPFQLPTAAPVIATFQTGNPNGNLVKYSRSTSDEELYNHVVVMSEASDADVIPYFGEAINTEPNSPTNVDRIGDRLAPIYTNAALESDQACRQLAQTMLAVSALESYDMSFDSIAYPWMEVGFVANIIEPDALDIDPTQFLLTSISLPMGLGPMSGQARRITYVADTESVDG